jgi:carbon monoxide dehydrogenase subunit G
MVPNQPQPALLFMPDISGFTQFVNETEIMHSQHIVQELLEILIDSNHLNLEICEVEGDAIFFYRLGNKPDLQSLLQQVEKMFTRFHQYLRLYEHQRICPCGACKTAIQLTLKVVAHFGEVTGISVKEHKKLFGKDVILIHRLLKNNLDKKEYVLVTDSVIKNLSQYNELPSWYNPVPGMEQYDVGAVQFLFSDLSPLHDVISTAKFPVHNSSSKTSVAFSKEEVIHAPMETVFEALLNLQQAAKLIEGTKKIEGITDDSLARIGTKHYCLITKNNSVNITESVKVEEENIELVEMNEKGVAGYRYILKKISPEQTRLSIQMLIKNNPIIKLFFSIAMKSNMLKRFREFFINLESYLRKTSVEELVL